MEYVYLFTLLHVEFVEYSTPVSRVRKDGSVCIAILTKLTSSIKKQHQTRCNDKIMELN